MMNRAIIVFLAGFGFIGAMSAAALPGDPDPDPVEANAEVADLDDPQPPPGGEGGGEGSVAGGGYDLWHRVAGGGETFSVGGAPGNEYSLGATIGQHEAGVMSGGGYTLAGGFWAGGAVADPTPPCPGDLTGSGSVGVPDLLALLGCWGPVSPGCEAADLTNSGTVGVPDLLALLGNWGPCP